MKILIGTTGFSYEDWSDPGIFYPPGLETAREQLKYYMTMFDFLTVSSTFREHPSTDLYREWAELASGADKPFNFLIVAPQKFTTSKTSIKNALAEWNNFWNGFVCSEESSNSESEGSSGGLICDCCGEECEVTEEEPQPDGFIFSGKERGGCKILHDNGVLGCLVLQFETSFEYSDKNINRILALTKKIPKTVRTSLVLFHWSWWENKERTRVAFSSFPRNWCLSTPFVENGLINFGWAGTLKSTRTQTAFTKKHKGPVILPTTDFAHVSFVGTYGPHIGSYDKNGFLEKCNKELKKLERQGIKTVFCSFDNVSAGTTFCNPLPGLVISTFFLNPQLETLEPDETDRPCCLHDAIKFKNIVATTRKYKRDSEGYVVIRFK